ncbi:hypothetical protein T11_15645 [Trichinella zimbabwensis]|uniref:Uncharacterized protein n=1 Tax=Trichinella zimbabwensis TaxID=268475 RepID=A0A0V1I6X9_9BILA|nr:hypothetical protein T11_15645 [Trichinella zimbabwensis]
MNSKKYFVLFTQLLVFLATSTIFASADGEVQFEKIQFSFDSLGSLSQTHKAIYNNDHLLLFGEQVDYESHEEESRKTILSDSYAIDIDLNTLTASKILYRVEGTREDVEEKLFAFNNHVFVVTYSTNSYFKYLSLYLWYVDRWKQMTFNTADIQFPMSYRHVEISISCFDSNTVIFATSVLGENLVILSKLEKSFGGLAYKLTRFYTTDELPLPSSHVLFMAYTPKRFIAIVEMNFGTYHWVPDVIMDFDKKSQRFLPKEIYGKFPNWAFSGPKYVFQSKDNFLLAGGTELIDIDQLDQSRDIWILNIPNCTYTQLPVQLPVEAMAYEWYAAFDVEKSIYYVINVDAGIYRVNLTRWLE